MKKILFALAVCAPIVSMAQAGDDFPRKPIQVIVPYGPGGAVDVAARIAVEHMARGLGQQIVVLNRPGGNANIGPAAVAQSQPDGYTLLASSSATVLNPLIASAIGWKAADLVPIARISQSPNLIVVSTALGVKNMREFVEHARRNPGLTTPVTGLGSSQAVARENFKQAAGLQFLDVGYKGGTSFMTDLIAGRLALSVSPLNVVVKQVKSGQLVALANTGEKRSPMAPDIPTVAEAGYPQAMSMSWFGFHAPAGVPSRARERLAEAVRKAVEDADVKTRILAVGAEPAFLTGPALDQFLDEERQRGERFLKAIGHQKK
jgi:tripartite-type tricarboxylate transporter receptor subunit TctC